MNRVAFYYQTFSGLSPDLRVTDIYISSVHFGTDQDGEKYIHINDDPPDADCQRLMWKQTELFANRGVRIGLMVGGAGGGYAALFSDFDSYYPMLVDCINKHPWVTGVDLDVEEEVSMENIRMLIRRIRADFGTHFRISMAPLRYSLATDQAGMGGFVYKELYNTAEGRMIDYFNVQAYDDYSVAGFDQMVSNGYPANQLVFGMLSAQFNHQTAGEIMETLRRLRLNHPDIGGVFDWELFNATPSPVRWSELMTGLMNPPLLLQLADWASGWFRWLIRTDCCQMIGWILPQYPQSKEKID